MKKPRELRSRGCVVKSWSDGGARKPVPVRDAVLIDTDLDDLAFAHRIVQDMPAGDLMGAGKVVDHGRQKPSVADQAGRDDTVSWTGLAEPVMQRTKRRRCCHVQGLSHIWELEYPGQTDVSGEDLVGGIQHAVLARGFVVGNKKFRHGVEFVRWVAETDDCVGYPRQRGLHPNLSAFRLSVKGLRH